MKVNDILKNPYFLWGLGCIYATFIPEPFSSSPNLSMCYIYLYMAASFALICTFIYFICVKKLDSPKVMILMAIGAFIFRAAFAFHVPYTGMQFDFKIPDNTGHEAYIKWFLYNGFVLRHFNGIPAGQFYHPPLHHFLAACFLKLNFLLGITERHAWENLQLLTLFYSGCITITAYKIFKEFDLKGIALVIPFAIICFHPTALLFSVRLNNDELCLMWMLFTLLATIKWHKQPTLKGIIIIAACHSLAMLSKSSGILLAPGIAFVFLSKFYQNKNMRQEMLIWFTIFLLISVPMSSSWVLYNKYKNGMPLNYIPLASKECPAYIGNYSMWQRLFKITLSSIKDPFVMMEPIDYSIPIVALKTALFADFRFYSYEQKQIITIARLLFYSNILFAPFCLFGVLYSAMNRPYKTTKYFLLLIYLTMLASYLIFCKNWPHYWTQDYRYISINLYVSTTVYGLIIDKLNYYKTLPFYILRAAIITAALSLLYFTIIFYNFYILDIN